MADGKVIISTKLDNSGFTNGIAGLKNAVKSFAATVGIAFGTVALVNFGKEAVKTASEMKSAFTGLKSIVDGQGRSFKEAKAFIQDYISDGLIPAKDAVTAYKNLAMRGYDDKQIQEVMIALKNSSAYGRSAALTMGESVSSATEGLKNENSILVDNAGVTKNVSMMWKDYAKSIGVGVDSLTQQQKIQAEVNGILHETRFQTGDAAKVAGDYAGQVLGLKFAVNDFKIALGNMIIPISQVVIPAFKTMINAATRLINILGQVTGVLFGTAASGQQQIADSANAAADAETALGDATKEAGKEAKGSLGAFDELNVLQKDTGTDSGVDAVGGGGGTVAPPVDTTESEGVLSEAAQRMLSFLEPLQQISFDNLSASFERLKEAVAPLGKALFAGLEWAYDNIFVPFATWTVEQAAPAFLDALAKAADALSKALEALQPLGIWLWDNFLQPLASWTGGTVIKVFESITSSLGKVSDWIAKNQGLIGAMAITVGAFFAAWKVTELAAFIQMSGGLITVLGRVAVALGMVTVAKIKDIAQTAALTVMYAVDFVKALGTSIQTIGFLVVAKAKDMMQTAALMTMYAVDFVVATAKSTAALVAQCAQWAVSTAAIIAQTVAQWAQNVAIGAWTALTTVATTVTAAFGAVIAFLTSPIGLVIAAIVALIAIVVLLVKNWDDVKAFAIGCWEAIVECWNIAAEWIYNTVVQPIAQFFTGLWDSIKAVATSCWEAVKSCWNAVAGWFDKTVVKPVAGFFTGLWDGIVKAFNAAWEGMSESFKSYINGWLNLLEGFANFFVNMMNRIIEALNSISVDIPDWVPEFGGSTFGINIPRIPEIKLPRLAQGAVIPANREFMAVLGDQKHGTNLEAPADLIRQIVREETAGLSQQDSQPILVEFLLDGDVLYRKMVDAKNRQGYPIGGVFANAY